MQELMFQLRQVAALALLDPLLELSLIPLHLLSLSVLEGSLFLIQGDLFVSGDTGFDVGETAYSLCWNNMSLHKFPVKQSVKP